MLRLTNEYSIGLKNVGEKYKGIIPPAKLLVLHEEGRLLP